MKYSKNNRAEEIVGLRHDDLDLPKGHIGMAFDLPISLGYKCPVCKVKSEGLCFSEYNGFLYCQDCNKDIPSVLCLEDIEKATEIYLDIIQDIKGT